MWLFSQVEKNCCGEVHHDMLLAGFRTFKGGRSQGSFFSICWKVFSKRLSSIDKDVWEEKVCMFFGQPLFLCHVLLSGVGRNFVDEHVHLKSFESFRDWISNVGLRPHEPFHPFLCTFLAHRCWWNDGHRAKRLTISLTQTSKEPLCTLQKVPAKWWHNALHPLSPAHSLATFWSTARN